MTTDVPLDKAASARGPSSPSGSSGVSSQADIALRPSGASEIQTRAEIAAKDELKEKAPEAAAILEEKSSPDPGLRRELGLLVSAMFQPGHRWVIGRLALGVFLILLVNMFGQVRLNEWNGAFFDAVEKKDVGAFMGQLGVFLIIVGFLLFVVVAQTWMQERLKLRMRERLSQVLMDAWLKPSRAYQLGFAGEGGGAPDQRMQEDTRLAAEMSTGLGIGMLQASLLLISFIGVLWGLSSQVSLNIFGNDVVIPGYMVWVAIGYAAIGSTLTWMVGRPLIKLNTDRYAREAELRFALVRVNESAESVALYGGEKDERRILDQTLASVVEAMRKVSNALSRLTWITSGYGWMAIVVPILAAAPGYFSGQLTFGGLMMVVGAFTQVQNSLNWFVSNFPSIADWRSAVKRVATFYNTVEGMDLAALDATRIELKPHPQGKLSFEGLSIGLADGSVVIEDATAEIEPGQRVLIAGESGTGKSTLFRAISGLWPWGEGIIQHPPRDQMMFLPQRPYLPLGTLKGAVCYPHAPDAFTDEAVQASLARCGLEEFTGSIHEEGRWDKSLSLGQQQRLAFARLLIHKPAWVFLDEATAALDDENQTRVMRLFDEDLPGTTVMSIAHRPGMEVFHNRTLTLQKTEQGAVLFARRGRSAGPVEPWRRRLAQWIVGYPGQTRS